MISLGDFRIARAVEHEGPFVRPQDFFPDWDPAVLEETRDWGGPVMDAASGQMILSFHAFVLRTGRHTIVVDTCLGNDKERPLRPVGHRRKGDFMATLAAAGARPEEVDFVMCTHLHWDHVGWNTRLADGRWVPTFPNARYVMARREYEHMDDPASRGDDTACTGSRLPTACSRSCARNAPCSSTTTTPSKMAYGLSPARPHPRERRDQRPFTRRARGFPGGRAALAAATRAAGVVEPCLRRSGAVEHLPPALRGAACGHRQPGHAGALPCAVGRAHRASREGVWVRLDLRRAISIDPCRETPCSSR